MIKLGLCLIMIIFNFILYFAFGALITGRMKKEPFSITLSILAGFFLYYSLFTFFCIPVMYKVRPLSLLTLIWGVAVLIILILSFVVNRKTWKTIPGNIGHFFQQNKLFCVGMIILVLIQTFVIVYSYQFTLDAAYYVANVTTSLATDTMNIYDPYTGDWQNHFEMRYFFATYSINDAVMCRIFPIHPLMQTKIVMSSIAVILTNILYYKIGTELFEDRKKPVFVMILFAGIINFNFITIYTSSNFLITRTYEGKSLLGNVVLPGIIYIYIRLLKDHKAFHNWFLLFLTCFGATVLSSSANMLVPATLSVLLLPLIVMKKDYRIIPKYVICMLPCLIMLVVYYAYVKGMFVLYTY